MKPSKYLSKTLTIVLLSLGAIVFFSCGPRSGEAQKLFIRRNQPIPNAEIRDFTAYYTLKGQLALRLDSPLLKDFSQYDFAYQWFPRGIKMEIYNRRDRKDRTIITADTAAMYKDTQILELRGNVRIHNLKNEELTTGRLYWDRVNEHIFTDDRVVFRRNEEYIKGTGFDSNMSFTDARVNNVKGIFRVKKKID